ncbi:hypothetical protein MBLNU230_g2136t1 [Neophaeotheca triangularis]
MDLDDSFRSASNHFLAWLKRNGTTISEKIQLADLRGRKAGRGVVALSDIAEDETLFTIPRKSILTAETSGLPSHLKTTFEDSWLSTILAMLYEYQQGGNSAWSPYLEVLPAEFDTPIFWTEDELRYLKGSALPNKIGKQSADATFRDQILPVVRNHQEIFNATGLTDEDLLKLCHRLASTIMAYAFDLEPTSEQQKEQEDGWEEDSDAGAPASKGMVPLADMLNADADRNNAKLFYEDEAVVMKSIVPISREEEIFNDYGSLPRADVLRRYGYVTGNYAKYDVCEISAQLILEVAAQRAGSQQVEALKKRHAYLEEQGVADEEYDVYRLDSEDGPVPEELAILLNALSMSKEDFEKLRKKDKLPKPEPLEESKQLLFDVLLNRLAEYPVDSELSESEDESQAAYRRNMAVQVVQGEKTALTELAGFYAEGNEGRKDILRRATHEATKDAGDERGGKRRKIG